VGCGVVLTRWSTRLLGSWHNRSRDLCRRDGCAASRRRGPPRYSRTTTSCATLTSSNSLTFITRANRGGDRRPSYSRRTRHEGLRRTLRNCPSYWRDLSRNHPSAAPVRIFSIPYCLAPFLKLRRARGRSFQERTGQQRQSRLGQDALEGSLSRERFLHATLRCLPAL